MMIDGIPPPALMAFLADNAPHVVHLSFPSSLKGSSHLLRVYGANQGRVDCLQHRLFLFELTEHSVRTDLQHARRIAHPIRIEAHGNDVLFHLGHTASVAVLKQNTPPGTGRVLAQVALWAAVRFPAFDDLLAVAVGTSDRDKGHGPLLACRSCQDVAQCDSNLSPSPLLEHYQPLESIMTRNIYALLIGIDMYPAPVSPLEGCGNDIEAIETYLSNRINTQKYQLHLKKLRDGEATRQAIIEGFERYLCQAGSNDIAFFYYSGHGSNETAPPEFFQFEPDRQIETIVCYDSRLEGGRDLADKD
jgi:hypothetical protein